MGMGISHEICTFPALFLWLEPVYINCIENLSFIDAISTVGACRIMLLFERRQVFNTGLFFFAVQQQ